MSASRPLLPLPALPKPGARVDLPPLAGSADALALAELAGRNRATRWLSSPPARRCPAAAVRDSVVCAEPQVRLLPDWETLPYDSFSPHQDLISERLATLWAALQGEVEMLIVPASTAVNRLAPPEFMAAYTFFFKKGEKLDADKLRSQLTLAGYQHVTQVVAPGE